MKSRRNNKKIIKVLDAIENDVINDNTIKDITNWVLTVLFSVLLLFCITDVIPSLVSNAMKYLVFFCMVVNLIFLLNRLNRIESFILGFSGILIAVGGIISISKYDYLMFVCFDAGILVFNIYIGLLILFIIKGLFSRK